MTPNEYQEAAARTMRQMPLFTTLSNMGLGIAGEAGEVADEIKKIVFHGHALDKDNLIKEIGDVQWYVAALCTALDISLEGVMETNIAKLKARFPNGFSEQDSINRKA